MTKEQKFRVDAENFRRLIRLVRRRMFLRDALDALATNFMLAAIVSLVFAVVCSVADRFPTTPAVYSFATFLIAIVATVLSFAMSSKERYAAERALDQRCDLDDRCLTAAELLQQTNERDATQIERLQMEDCFERVDSIKPSDVVDVKIEKARPRLALLTVVVILLALVVWKPFSGQALAGAPENEIVLESLDDLDASILPAIAQLAAENPNDANLAALNEKLRALAEQIKTNADDPKKATEIFAQMQAEVRKTIEATGVEATDAALKEVGDAMSGFSATSSISQALADGDYDLAADELEKLDFEKMNARDRQALAEKLRAAAEIIRSRKDEQTAALTEQLADELQAGKCASCHNTACKLAGRVRQQKKNKENVKQLDCQMARLGLCKANCAGACATCSQNAAAPQNQNAVPSGGEGSGAAGGSAEKTLGSSNADNPLAGKNENLDAKRELVKVSGKESAEGDSAIERVKSNEATVSTASRERDVQDREYARQIESVLDEDAVPAERRQVVRDYFDSLRKSDREKVREN